MGRHSNVLADEPVFFVLAILICPAAFQVGVIGTILLAARKPRQSLSALAPIDIPIHRGLHCSFPRSSIWQEVQR